MLAILSGLPAGFAVDTALIDAWLKRRQGGYGRSSRQQLEQDRVDVLAGRHRGRTTGAPVALMVWNRDDSLAAKPAVRRPRPGHGDLAGGQKYDLADMRPVLERASARETAARVAAGALAATILQDLGITVLGHVVRLGGVAARPPSPRVKLETLLRRREGSPFHTLDRACEPAMRAAVDAARADGDTLGGVFEVVAHGVPAGLGSLDEPASRLDARLAGALMSIQAIKAVELGDGLAVAEESGRTAHDPIGPPGPSGPTRGSNRAGGLEAGMSNGQPVVARAWMKPLATLMSALPSWDYEQGRAAAAHVERSDVTAVPAASVVGEAMVGLVLLDALLEKTGGDHRKEVAAALGRHRKALARRFGKGASRGGRGA
jgi:chorismate synthase